MIPTTADSTAVAFGPPKVRSRMQLENGEALVQLLCLRHEFLFLTHRTQCQIVNISVSIDVIASDDDGVVLSSSQLAGGEMAQWLKRKFTDQKIRGSNLTFASRLPLSGLCLSVSQPSGFLWVAWQLGTEWVLQLSDLFSAGSLSSRHKGTVGIVVAGAELEIPQLLKCESMTRISAVITSTVSVIIEKIYTAFLQLSHLWILHNIRLSMKDRV
ncbi:LOW QUALITY PROTEIN: hypothetical protein T265_14282 [Opisthorchis viverrini]|uniref:Uncharacterized protein n=1 Tax=Opisthorchis viverrini TaxID=6198 RepID=A0A075ABN3_OPIVI|nr:LOW QUALITY PROTEIN: hypothetical protein T265_14282 [Opisthorchis viverrini]KER25064.1 LOW QUALITY PROTEIN: hypothetical protein T265_14282 [Opisthorchis viverrini]